MDQQGIEQARGEFGIVHLPKRLSSVKGDRGWKPNETLRRFRVFFNDVERFDCEIADVDKGYIRTVRRVQNPLTRQVQTFRSDLFGKVEIRAK
jgi:hypothetical protein